MKFRTILAALFSIIGGVFFITIAHAGILSGTIDPANSGSYYAQFLTVPDVGNGSTEKNINFGKFANQSGSNISIDDNGFHGYAWAGTAGWIVMNCQNTTSGCSSTNGNFKVDFTREGILKGYAWGENTGWINFGPFTNTAISRVQISDEGDFGGTSGTAGYAWSENYGWIIFDCSVSATCVKTDYRPPATRPACSNLIDDDEDGDIDLADRGCSDIYDDSEPYVSVGSVTQCADTIDNDGDGLVDMADAQCGGGSVTEFAPALPWVPEALTPIVPGVVRPVYPPRLPSTPAQSNDTPINESQIEPEESIGGDVVDIPIISPIIETVADIVRGTIDVPEARDRVIEFLRTVVMWVREFFEQMNHSLVSLMSDKAVQDAIVLAAVLGLVTILAPAIPLFALVPIAGINELLLFPRVLWHSLGIALGMKPSLKSWGTVYDSVTHLPIVLGEVSLIDAYGAIAATTLTQSDGSFSAVVPDGSYTLRVNAQKSTLALASGTALIYDTVYSAQPVLVRDNQPARPLDVAVLGGSGGKPTITSIKEFMLYHEVAFTNIAFLIFGIGTLASVLYVIFFPSLMSLLICLTYVLIAILRGVGAFGSYASVFLSKVAETPLAGQLITVFDMQTNTPVLKTLTSALGRAYLHLPDGYFYGVISDPSPLAEQTATVITKPFVARNGLFRKRFLL